MKEQFQKELDAVRKARTFLRSEKIIQHEKPIHCELAEWLVAKYLNGTRAISGNQKGWDVVLSDGRKIQVKSHAKAPTNNSPWTTLSGSSENVSELFVIIFSIDYFITAVYRIAMSDAEAMCNSSRQVTWGKLERAEKKIELPEIKKEFPFLFST